MYQNYSSCFKVPLLEMQLVTELVLFKPSTNVRIKFNFFFSSGD